MLCTPAEGIQQAGQKRAEAHVFARPSSLSPTCTHPPNGVVIVSVWTTGQNDTIRELGHRGVQVVHDALLARYGVDRSLHSIEAQASRIHASLRVQTVCPECGVVGVRLNRQTGLCAKCSEMQHLLESIAFNDVLLRERLELADEKDIEEIRRENASMRQRNSRLCRKYNLPSLRDRKRVCDKAGQCQYEKTEVDICPCRQSRGDEAPRAE